MTDVRNPTSPALPPLAAPARPASDAFGSQPPASGARGNEQLALRVSPMPRETNGHGTVFGGVILGYIDQAASIHTRLHGCRKVVTVVMREVVFKQPVYVGDIVSFYTQTVRVGRTSIAVAVRVEAERWANGEIVQVTEGEAVFVHLDAHDQPTPVPYAEPMIVHGAGFAAPKVTIP